MIDERKTATISGAERLLGIPRATIDSACKSGKIPAIVLACGARVVRLSDVTRWAKDWTPGVRGRKPKRA